LIESMKPRVFLCHAHEDQDIVNKYYDLLSHVGFMPWLDKKDLLPGQRWDIEIEKALKTSDFIIIFFSRNSVSKRGYVQKEFKLSLDLLDYLPEDQVAILPVRLEDVEIPYRFAHLQVADVFESNGFEKVVETIRLYYRKKNREQNQAVVSNGFEQQLPFKQSLIEGYNFNLKYKGSEQQMLWVPAGEFMMGSPETEEGRNSNERQHKVTLTNGFWMADTACTQEFYQVVMGENPSEFIGAQNPVEQVSWYKAKEFLVKLSFAFSDLVFSLPTEAEWEYACRAGTTTMFSFGHHIFPWNVNCDHRINNQRRSREERATVPVKSLPPNDWGFYEMHGNVVEWCEDGFADFTGDDLVDPKGLQEAGNKVYKGGSSHYVPNWCRSAFRHGYGPASKHQDGFGFRFCCNVRKQATVVY